jgi:hypothetical protein
VYVRVIAATARRQEVASGRSIQCNVPGHTVQTPASTAQPGAWASVACTLGGGSLAIWIDGRRARETAAADLVPGSQAAEIAFGLNSPSGDNFEGLLDNLRIWRTPRTPLQICAAAPACR